MKAGNSKQVNDKVKIETKENVDTVEKVVPPKIYFNSNDFSNIPKMSKIEILNSLTKSWS